MSRPLSDQVAASIPDIITCERLRAAQVAIDEVIETAELAKRTKLVGRLKKAIDVFGEMRNEVLLKDADGNDRARVG